LSVRGAEGNAAWTVARTTARDRFVGACAR
jgi:hypothetical protein